MLWLLYVPSRNAVANLDKVSLKSLLLLWRQSTLFDHCFSESLFSTIRSALFPVQQAGNIKIILLCRFPGTDLQWRYGCLHSEVINWQVDCVTLFLTCHAPFKAWDIFYYTCSLSAMLRLSSVLNSTPEVYSPLPQGKPHSWIQRCKNASRKSIPRKTIFDLMFVLGHAKMIPCKCRFCEHIYWGKTYF